MEAVQAYEWFQVAESGAIPEGEARTFLAGAHRVAVARADGKLYAVEDVCSHDDGPLGEGCLSGFAIQCPRHGAKFDVRSGDVLSMPAIAPIDTFPVREQDGVVSIGVDPSSAGTEDHDDW